MLEQPLYYFRSSVAPSGMAFYTGGAFPAWEGSLFLYALSGRHLNRFTAMDGRVLHEDHLLEDRDWCIRVVKQGPDDLLYLEGPDTSVHQGPLSCHGRWAESEKIGIEETQ